MEKKLQELVIDYIKSETKTSTRTGKPFVTVSFCAKMHGETVWFQGFGNKETENWEKGSKVMVKIWVEPYNGKDYWKFQTVEAIDLLDLRVSKLEKIVAGLSTPQSTTIQQKPVTSADLPPQEWDNFEPDLKDIPF